MKAVFINPFPGGHGLNEATIIQPVGLAYMAAVLEQNGFPCAIIDANLLRLSNEEILKGISKESRLAGLYVNSFTYDSARNLASLIRKQFKETVIVLGGPLPTAAPQMVLDEIQCDGLIRGEGEYAVLRIMQNISAGLPPFDEKVSGAVFFEKEKSRLVQNPVYRIENLDELPFPAYHLLPSFESYKVRSRRSPTAPIVTSRGCAYNCIFCSKDVFERQVTFRSAENVLTEIDYLVRKYNICQINILDDNFAFKKMRLEAILDGLIARKYKLDVNIQSGIRTELLDDELLEKMKLAGVYKLAFGIESADEYVLKLARKQIDLRKVRNIIQTAKKKGFIVYGFFIIGLPGETEDAFGRTIAYARSLNLDIANFCMAIPFIGTELHRMISENGRFLIDTTRNISSGFYDGKVFFEYGHERAEDILNRYERAYKEFYSFVKKLSLLLKIRSVNELRWYWDAASMVIKNVIKRHLH